MRLAAQIHDGPAGAPPLVIAHGLFGSAQNWRSLARRLARGRRVIAADLRNHGDSGWDAEAGYPAMAGDLAETIRTEAGGRADMLGHSMGGKAAMALALTAPDAVRRLVVADIAPVAYDHAHGDYVAAMRALDLGRVSRRSDADPLLAAAIPQPALRAFILQNLVVEDGGARWRVNLDALEANMEALLGFPAALSRKSWSGPALFLRGGASDYVRDAHLPAVRALFPAAVVKTLPEAGHWLHADRPEAFLAAVEGFLASPGAEG
jgi:pimeloyl-ACP methyl ester carboxylesterase